MIARYPHGSIVWIDLDSPTAEEVKAIMTEFSLDPEICEELLAPSLKPRIDLYSNCIYLILHFPAFRHTHQSDSQLGQEIDFVIGKKFVITTRYETIDPLHKFSKMFEVDSILGRRLPEQHGGFLFYAMAKKLYRALEYELEYIRDRLEEAELGVFNGNERKMVFILSNVGRDLLNFRQALRYHEEVLESFNEGARDFFGNDFGKYVSSVLSEYHRVERGIEGNVEALHELRETNNALLSTKQNLIMQRFTILAFVTFPLTLFTSLFGMNTTVTPILGHPYDFWIITGIMVAVTLVMFAYFKYKNGSSWPFVLGFLEWLRH